MKKLICLTTVIIYLVSLGNAFAHGKAHRHLRFNADGTFKIIQFTDTQDDQDIDPRTVALISAVLEQENPDLVVFTGDNIKSGPQTVEDVKVAIDNIAATIM